MPSGMLPVSCAQIRTLRSTATRGVLVHGHLRLPCALGRTGIVARKREGDGASPLGTWHIEQIYYRADRMLRPRTALPVRKLTNRDAWCDVTGDANYNRLVRLPYPVIDERLWRDDHLYDIVGILSYNRIPRVQGLGSAIFLHGARAGYLPTAGCVALSIPDLLKLLEHNPTAISFN